MSATDHEIIAPITLQFLEGEKGKWNLPLVYVSKTFLHQKKVYVLEDEIENFKESVRFNFSQYIHSKNKAIYIYIYTPKAVWLYVWLARYKVLKIQ